MTPENQIGDSDRGMDADLDQPWTIQTVQAKALELEKDFEPSSDIADRLEADLANGALVLFTQEEVNQAIEQELIPLDWRQGLTELVVEKNDIAVIPPTAVQNPKDEKAEQLLRFLCTGR